MYKLHSDNFNKGDYDDDAKQLSTLRARQLTLVMSAPVGCYCLHSTLSFCIVQPEDTESHCSKGVQPMHKAVYYSSFCYKHANCFGWDLHVTTRRLRPAVLWCCQ